MRTARTGLFAVTFTASLAIAESVCAQQTSPSPYKPNDPQYDQSQADAIGLPMAYAEMIRREAAGQVKMQQAVMVFLDDWVDTSHPEFQSTVISSLTFNATDQPYV